MSAANAPAAEQHDDQKVRKDAVVNVRLPTRVRDLIDNAATLLGKTRTEFMVESAKQHATDVLLDQRLFALPAEQYEAFLNALDGPRRPTEKLKRLLSERSPWE